MRELCVFSFPLPSLPSSLNTPAEMLHINGNTPFGLANSGRIIAVSSVARPKKKKNGNSLRLKRRHVCIWHKVVPVQTVNHLCSQIAGQPPTWGRGWVRSTLLPINLCLHWERPGNFWGPNPNFKSKPVEQQHSSYLTIQLILLR